MNTRILIVEDERNIAELLKVNLMADGFDVAMACDGQKGLAMAMEQRPDALILDVRLPIMNGWDVCRALRNNPETHDMAIIILTAATQKSDQEASVRAGCDLCLAKPFDPVALADVVHGIIRSRRENKLQHKREGV